MEKADQEGNDNQGQDSHHSLRISIMFSSFLMSLLLWSLSFPPIFVSLCLSSLVSTFSYEILGIIDPEDTLSIEFGSDNRKISGKFVGGFVAFLVVWGGAFFALDRDLYYKNTELALDKTQGKNQQSVYVIPKKYFSKVQIVKDPPSVAVGKIDFSTEFEELKNADIFNPVLVKIREDCKNKQGLCALPDTPFIIRIIGSDKTLEPHTASVCLGHGYLEGETLKISDQNKPQEELDEKNSFTIKVVETDQKCSKKDFPYPRLKLSKDFNNLTSFRNKNSYASITGL